MKELKDLVALICRAAIVDRSIWTWPHAPHVRVSSVQPSLVQVSPCRRLHNMHEHWHEDEMIMPMQPSGRSDPVVH
jgi:hypothetical protein